MDNFKKAQIYLLNHYAEGRTHTILKPFTKASNWKKHSIDEYLGFGESLF
jgi:hypothetical protein